MDSDMRQLIMDVMDGNPGAFVIVRRLMYFTIWYQLLLHLKNNDLIGSHLWQVVKDDYGHDWMKFAYDQLTRMGPSGEQALRATGRFLPYHYN